MAEQSQEEQARRNGRPRLTGEVIEERIQFICRLLRQGRSRTDTRRMFRQAFQIKSPRIFANYLAAALRRHREAVEKNHDERLAETVAFWSRIIQDAEERIERCRRSDEGYVLSDSTGEQHVIGNVERAANAELMIWDGSSTSQQVELAVCAYEFAHSSIRRNHRMAHEAMKAAMLARRELDRILGMRTPVDGLSKMTDEESQAEMLRLGIKPLRFDLSAGEEPACMNGAAGMQDGGSNGQV